MTNDRDLFIFIRYIHFRVFHFSFLSFLSLGYGHIAPKTYLGKISTIFYAILGIPLMLLCLSNIGDIMASSFRYTMLTMKFGCKTVYSCILPPSLDSFTGEFAASFVPENRNDLGIVCDAKIHFAIRIEILVNRINRCDDLWEYHSAQLILVLINTSLVWCMLIRTLSWGKCITKKPKRWETLRWGEDSKICLVHTRSYFPIKSWTCGSNRSATLVPTTQKRSLRGDLFIWAFCLLAIGS